MRAWIAVALALSFAGCADSAPKPSEEVAEVSYAVAIPVDPAMSFVEERVEIPAGVQGVTFEIDYLGTAPASSSGDRFGDVLVEYGNVMVNGTRYFGAWSHSCDEEALEAKWGCLSDEDGGVLFDLPAPDGAYQEWLGSASSCWDEANRPEAVTFRITFLQTQGAFDVRIKSSDSCPTAVL